MLDHSFLKWFFVFYIGLSSKAEIIAGKTCIEDVSGLENGGSEGLSVSCLTEDEMFACFIK